MEDITFAAVMLYLQGMTALQGIEWFAAALLGIGIYWYPSKPRLAPVVGVIGCGIFGYISITAELWGMAFVNTALCGVHVLNFIKACRASSDIHPERFQ